MKETRRQFARHVGAAAVAAGPFAAIPALAMVKRRRPPDPHAEIRAAVARLVAAEARFSATDAEVDALIDSLGPEDYDASGRSPAVRAFYEARHTPDERAMREAHQHLAHLMEAAGIGAVILDGTLHLGYMVYSAIPDHQALAMPSAKILDLDALDAKGGRHESPAPTPSASAEVADIYAERYGQKAVFYAIARADYSAIRLAIAAEGGGR